MNRRQFLLASGSVAATTGLAGCSGILGDDDDAGGLDDVGSWLPDPRAIDSDLNHYSFEARSPAAQAEAAEGLRSQDEYRPTPTFGSVTTSDVDSVISVNNADTSDARYSFDVYHGSFDEEWIGTVLQNNGYDSGRDVDELNIYEQDDTQAVAISPDLAIEATHTAADPDVIRLVQTLVDTESGDESRYTEVLNGDMEVLLNALPGTHAVNGRTMETIDERAPQRGRFSDQVAQGYSETIDGREVERHYTFVFDGENSVAQPRYIDEFIEESGAFASSLSRPDYEVDGRAMTVSSRTPLS